MRSSQPTKPKLSPLRQADHARLAVKIGQHVELAHRTLEVHRRRQVGHEHHRNGAALAETPHDPAAERVAQTGMQIEPARVRRIVQRRMAAKLEAASPLRLRCAPGNKPVRRRRRCGSAARGSAPSPDSRRRHPGRDGGQQARRDLVASQLVHRLETQPVRRSLRRTPTARPPASRSSAPLQPGRHAGGAQQQAHAARAGAGEHQLRAVEIRQLDAELVRRRAWRATAPARRPAARRTPARCAGSARPPR